MKYRIIGNKTKGFRIQYRRHNLWCYVTENKATSTMLIIRVFSTRESAEQYAKLMAEAKSMDELVS